MMMILSTQLFTSKTTIACFMHLRSVILSFTSTNIRFSKQKVPDRLTFTKSSLECTSKKIWISKMISK